MNHSCSPSVRLDCTSLSLIALVDLNPGDEINFFYPSTEWNMAKPFQCWCESLDCCKLISGAKGLDSVQQSRHHLEPHILEMIALNAT